MYGVCLSGEAILAPGQQPTALADRITGLQRPPEIGQLQPGQSVLAAARPDLLTVIQQAKPLAGEREVVERM